LARWSKLTTTFHFLYLGIAGPKEGLMKSAKRQFDPQAFLAKVGTGKTILKYRKGRNIFAQGEEADKIRAPSSSAGQLRKKWKANTSRCFDQSNNLGGDDRNDPIPRELFPVQIS
jgi:hypothetical protein